jgi:hypothetical protein
MLEVKMRRDRDAAKAQREREEMKLFFCSFAFPSRLRAFAVSFLIAALAFSNCALAEISKGHRLLIEYGFQIQGMATKDDVFHLDTYQKANYTAINWLFQSDVSKHGPPPGFFWGRWCGNENEMPPVGNEKDYMSRLITLSLGDEKNINDSAIREPYIKWFNEAVPKYPKAIVYVNNYGGQAGDAALADFITRAKPDMIVFDTYPFRSDYTTKKPQQPAGGNPIDWYWELRRYREHARQRGIPFGTYRQSFHAEQDYDQKIYRDPSLSEFRLNTFGALAFNCKMLIDFTYNTGASSYFKKPGGDTHPTPLYDELRIVNREVRNLGPALVRLKPIEDIKTPDQRTTGMMFIRGKHRKGDDPNATELNPIPVGFAADPASETYTDWEANRNDPYLRGWAVENIGTANHKLPGDVILSWFKVLDESFDGNDAKDEIYLMITNGLSDMAMGPAQCRQKITLNFSDEPATAAVQKLSRKNGKVEEIELRLDKKRRQLVLELDGGTCELIKFKTGAPFVGVK